MMDDTAIARSLAFLLFLDGNWASTFLVATVSRRVLLIFALLLARKANAARMDGPSTVGWTGGVLAQSLTGRKGSGFGGTTGERRTEGKKVMGFHGRICVPNIHTV